jgi:hypothetical protein
MSSSQRYAILPIYKPPIQSVKESAALQVFREFRVSRLSLPLAGMLPLNRDNTCSFRGHLLTVEMLLNLAGMAAQWFDLS